MTEGATIEAIHCPGHAADHMAFLLGEEGAIFTGDNVLGHGSVIFEELGTYLQSLDLMRKLSRGRAYPGHGEVIANGREKIDEYIRHRRDREEEILTDLSGVGVDELGGVDGNFNAENRGGRRAKTAGELVSSIYTDVPKDLWEPAERVVIQMLENLEIEGRVWRNDENRWMIS